MREADFGALITVDRRIEYQQDVARSGVGMVVLHAHRSRIQELAPLALAITQALGTIAPGVNRASSISIGLVLQLHL